MYNHIIIGVYTVHAILKIVSIVMHITMFMVSFLIPVDNSADRLYAFNIQVIANHYNDFTNLINSTFRKQ